jgi:hypothetical protein
LLLQLLQWIVDIDYKTTAITPPIMPVMTAGMIALG